MTLMIGIPPRRLFCAVVLMTSIACNATNHVLGPSSDGGEAVRVAAAVLGLEEAPLALAAGGTVMRVWPLSSACPSTYDLGGGVTGSCVRLDQSGYYYGSYYQFTTITLSTMAYLPGGGPGLEMPFDLRVEPGNDNSSFLSVWDAYANVNQGNGAWKLSGRIYTDAAGNTEDLQLSLRTSHCNWSLRSDSIEFQVPGIPAVSARVELDSGAGILKVGGETAAIATVSGGCVTFDFVDPATTDHATCMW
ncbi:MAG TPA: hypothetical protein VF139_11835 [Candidatus Polarisedimenticolaceae bacterium]